MKTFEGDTSLTFHYHMQTSSEDKTAALTVIIYSELHVYDKVLFQIQGNHGTSWKRATVSCLPAGTYQLAFVATHGLQFLSDIALDEIHLIPGPFCKGYPKGNFH